MSTYVYIWAPDYHSNPIELSLAIPGNAVKAVKFAIENGFGVYACHKELRIVKFMYSTRNAQILWQTISQNKEITPKLMRQIYPQTKIKMQSIQYAINSIAYLSH